MTKHDRGKRIRCGTVKIYDDPDDEALLHIRTCYPPVINGKRKFVIDRQKLTKRQKQIVQDFQQAHGL